MSDTQWTSHEALRDRIRQLESELAAAKAAVAARDAVIKQLEPALRMYRNQYNDTCKCGGTVCDPECDCNNCKRSTIASKALAAARSLETVTENK